MSAPRKAGAAGAAGEAPLPPADLERLRALAAKTPAPASLIPILGIGSAAIRNALAGLAVRPATARLISQGLERLDAAKTSDLEASCDELASMRATLRAAGYDPAAAEKLQNEGIDLFELGRRLEEIGGLTRTHGLQKIAARETRGEAFEGVR